MKNNNNNRHLSSSIVDHHRLIIKSLVGLMTRVPKAARANCVQLFTTLLKNIVTTPNNNESWKDLLLFGSTILAKPKEAARQEISPE